MDIANNPFFLSRSPSDFWGRRWNCLVHGVLKRGVYKPVRKYSANAVLASLATFIASGLLHEYVLSIITLDNEDPTAVRYGMHLAFFGYNAVVFTIEHLCGEAYIFKWSGQALHPTIVSLLVVLMVLPISHWFTDEYISAGFYTDYKVGFLVVVKVD